MPTPELVVLDASRSQDRGAYSPVSGPLPPVLRADLLDPVVWQDALEKYARATSLAVALVDAAGRPLGECVNPQPLWSLFRRKKPAGAGECPFALAAVTPCSCVADALDRGGPVVVHDRTGLAHIAVPLVLGDQKLGALVAGQVFVQYPQQLPLENLAKQFGLSPARVWEVARRQHPVKEATLQVYADLLATLGQTFLQTRYHTHREAELLAEMTRLRDRAVEAMAERQRADEALRISEQRLSAIFNQSIAGIAQTDMTGKFLLVNQRFCDIVGHSREELVRMRMQDLTDPKDFSPDLARFEQTLAGGGDFRMERRYVCADGSHVWVNNSVSVVTGQDGKPHYVIAVVEDLTERRRAEEALCQSADRFRFLAESMPQKTFTARPDGEPDYLNQQWAQLTGLSLKQMKGWGWTQFIHPSELAENIRRWRHSIDTGEPFQFEHRFRRADGTYRWHLTRAHALTDEAGKVVMWVGSATDIDDQKQVEQLLHETDRRKDEFLAMLAHELRNPLAPIRNAVQVMRLKGTADDDMQWARDVIDRQVQQMTRLVDDLLDVSRISRGKIDLRMEPVDLAKVVGLAVEVSRPLITARNHHLEVTLPEQPVRVEGDLARLSQVVSNLLNNAAKYTDAGGRIKLVVEPSGGEAVLRVRDTGAGIAADMLANIFGLFTQVQGSLSHADGGLGIGLTLVRSLVEMHGGSVEAISAGLGQGSEFIVRLSRLQEAPPPAAAATRPDWAPEGPARRILVVDDNVDAAESLALLLRLAGHEVRTAHDGPAALDAVRAQSPEVVLLDIALPGMSGLEVARTLRRDPGMANILLVALTGYGQEEDMRRSLEAGFNVHLVKPVTLDVLQALLARAKRPAPR